MTAVEGANVTPLKRRSAHRAGRPTYFTEDGSTWSLVYRDGEPIQSLLAEFEGEFTRRLTAPPQTTNAAESRTLAYHVTVRMGGRSYDGVIPVEDLTKAQWIDQIAPLAWRRRVGANSGMGDLVNALISLSGDVPTVTAPTRLGWSNIITSDGQLARVFVHAAGVIGKRAHEADVTTDILGEESAYYALPDPCSGEDLPALLEEFTSFLHVAPTYVTAALFGLVLRAPLGRNPSPLVLVAEKGTGKTALITSAVGMTALGLSHEDGSLGSPEDTKNSMLYDMHHKSDSIHVVDDYALTKLKKQQRMGELDAAVRQQFEGKGKARLNRHIVRRPSEEPRGSLVISTEDTGLLEGSALERVVIVPVLARTVSIDMGTVTLKDLDEKGSRTRRSSVFAAYVLWLSAFSPEEIAARTRAYANDMVTHLLDHTFHAADDRDLRHKVRRVVNNVSQYMAGIEMFCEFLDAAELESASARFRRACLLGLEDVARRQVAVQSEVELADKFISTVQSAIQRGRAHVLGNGYGTPGALDFGSAPSLSDLHATGWTASSAAMMDTARPNGEMIGYLAPGGRVMVTNWRVLMDIVARELVEDAIGIDRQTILKELYARGVIDGKADSARPFMVQKARPGTSGPNRQMQWVVNASAEALLGIYTTRTDAPTTDAAASDVPAEQPPAARQEVLTVDASNMPPEFTTSQDDSGRTVAREVPQASAPLDFFADEKEDEETPDESRPQSPVQAEPVTPQVVGPRPTVTSSARRFIVVDPSGVYLGDGSRLCDTPDFAHIGEVVQFAHSHRIGRKGGVGISQGGAENEYMGVVWMSHGMAAVLNLPARRQGSKSEPHPFVAEASDAGYTLDQFVPGKSGVRKARPVLEAENKVHYVVPGERTISCEINFASLSATSSGIRQAESLDELLTLLTGFVQLMGVPWRGRGRRAALELMRNREPQGDETVISDAARVEMFPHSDDLHRESDLHRATDQLKWARGLTADEQKGAYLHTYDRNADYFASMQSSDFGMGDVRHLSVDVEFNPRLKGMWRVRLDVSTHNRLQPSPFLALTASGLAPHDGPQWMTTEQVELALTDGVGVEVLEGYVWAKKKRVFACSRGRGVKGTWADILRDALAATINEPVLRRMVKSVYTELGGGFHSRKSQQHYQRPLWHFQIRALSMAAVMRTVRTVAGAGAYPVLVNVDALSFITDEPDPIVFAGSIGLDLSNQVGKYKHKSTVERDRFASAFMDGDAFWVDPTMQRFMQLRTTVDEGGK